MYFRDWHNSQLEMHDIRYEKKIKNEELKIKTYKKLESKEKSIDRTITEYNKQRIEVSNFYSIF